MKKICTACKKSKSLEDYYNKKGGLHGKTSECKSCMCERDKDWKRRNPERNRISSNAYNQRLNTQLKAPSSFESPQHFDVYASQKKLTLNKNLFELAMKCGFNEEATKLLNEFKGVI